MGLISNIQDKLSHNKDNTDSGVNSSYDTSSSGGLTGQGSHLNQQTGTTNTSTNPLSSNAAPHGSSSGITGGTHPVVSGHDNTSTVGSGIGSSSHHTPGHGTGEGSHLAGRTGQYDTHHTGTGIGSNTHHTGTGIGSNTHHTGTGIGSNTHTSGSGLTGGATHGTSAHHNSHGSNQSHQAVDFVPGSHPAANNTNSIPTAGGHKLGGVGEGVGHTGSHAGVHETAGDKIKNALPGQHGNAHDAYGNPINPSSTGAHTFSNQPTGSHTTGSHIPGTTGSHIPGTTGSHIPGTTGSHIPGTTGSHTTGSHIPGTTHTTQPGSGFSSSAQPLSHDSNFNDRHSGPGVGSGLAAGTVGGAGIASAGHHNSHNQTGSGLTHGSGTTGTHGTTHNTNTVGEDNRGIVDKAKDTLSSKRSNQPDDPITGTNYDQKNRDQYTQGTHGSGLTGGSHGTHSSSTHQPGVSGITSGVGQTHLGSNTHSGTHSSGLSHGHDSSNISHVGRSAEWKEGYQAGYREATLSLGSGSHGTHSSTTGAHSSTTGTGYNTNTKPTIGDKFNPKTDADRDGKVGFLD